MLPKMSCSSWGVSAHSEYLVSMPLSSMTRPEQVGEGPLRIPLDIKVDPDGADGDRGRLQNVDLPVPDRRRLEGEVVGLLLALDPLPPLPQPEGAGKLRDREDPLPIMLPKLFLAHPVEQTDVIIRFGLMAAAP